MLTDMVMMPLVKLVKTLVVAVPGRAAMTKSLSRETTRWQVLERQPSKVLAVGDHGDPDEEAGGADRKGEPDADPDLAVKSVTCNALEQLVVIHVFDRKVMCHVGPVGSPSCISQTRRSSETGSA
jgi:hypothetical protein